jgi:hypothetical protein
MQTFPTPASIRNAEQHTAASRLEHACWDAALSARLAKLTTLKTPPSIQMQAYRDYEYAKFGALNRRGAPWNTGYNLCTNAVEMTEWAHGVLTDPGFLRSTGFTKRTAPRRALRHIANAYGYRYIRGLEAIESGLSDDAQLAKFRSERMEFRHVLETSADAAHAINDKGQNPGAALEVVQMFARELLALCPWLELAGRESDARELGNRVSAILTGGPLQ